MAPRFRQRHVHQTCVDYLKTELDTLGWVNAPVNFGATPVTFLEYQPEEGGVTPAPNTVAITLGDEPADEEEELGGGLFACDYVLFVDVYGEDASTAISIASDVKDTLTHALIPLNDYTTDPAGVATTHTIEFDFVVVEKPAVATTNVDKRFWRVVKAIARLYFS